MLPKFASCFATPGRCFQPGPSGDLRLKLYRAHFIPGRGVAEETRIIRCWCHHLRRSLPRRDNTLYRREPGWRQSHSRHPHYRSPLYLYLHLSTLLSRSMNYLVDRVYLTSLFILEDYDLQNCF